jgi:hypothetical protein
MKIEFNDDCGLTDQERRQILRDALIEFMCNRLGYPEDMSVLRVRAQAYVDQRYEDQTPDWKASKVPQVISRWECAKRMLEALEAMK